jgi:hypothetical protein
MWNDPKLQFVDKEVWSMRVVHLLHHFRVCLEILHLLYFRKEAIEKGDTMKQYTYIANFSDEKSKYKRLVPENPLIIYTGWDMKKLKKDVNIDDAIKLIDPNMGYGEETIKYKSYYKDINSAFPVIEETSDSVRENRIDTFIEILCLIFSVNYKYYIYKNRGKTLLNADKYNPRNIPSQIPTEIQNLQMKTLTDFGTPGTYANKFNMSQVPALKNIFIDNADISRLCELYEKHCILIVHTLLLCGVNTFHVPYPPSNVQLVNGQSSKMIAKQLKP